LLEYTTVKDGVATGEHREPNPYELQRSMVELQSGLALDYMERFSPVDKSSYPRGFAAVVLKATPSPNNVVVHHLQDRQRPVCSTSHIIVEVSGSMKDEFVVSLVSGRSNTLIVNSLLELTVLNTLR